MRTTVAALLAAAAASAKNVRFCCKTEFPETQLGDPFCGRQDLIFVGHRQDSREWSRDTLFEFLNGVATNLLFLIPLRMLHNRRRTADTAACLGLIITSSAYHYCDVFRVKLLNMNAGNWHRTISESRGAAVPSRHRCDSCPSDEVVGGLFFDFGPIRTASRPQCPAQASTTSSPSSRRSPSCRC